MTADDGYITFLVLDGIHRTDTWMANHDELNFGTHPLEPDSDNDGLTDAQEAKWVTSAGQDGIAEVEKDATIPTAELSARDADSDGDGYWDGWIGVYGVGRTDNVVLYMDNLQTGNGIESGEIVQEQTGFHTVRKRSWPLTKSDMVSSARGADIDNDGWLEHSNVHLGELHWGTNPNKRASNAYEQTTLQVEVDYYENANKAALNVLPEVAKNYKLYGMSVGFEVDDELTSADLDCAPCMDDELPPTSLDDADEIEEQYHDDNTTLYMYVTTDGDNNPLPGMLDWAPDVDGVASSQGTNGLLMGQPNGLGFGVVIFTADHTEGPLRTHLQKTTVHEVGHIIGAGRADDDRQYLVFPDEVYSGGADDSTPEEVGYSGRERTEWSVMSAGWSNTVNQPPMSGRYVAFSIEELSSIEFDNIDTVEN